MADWNDTGGQSWNPAGDDVWKGDEGVGSPLKDTTNVKDGFDAFDDANIIKHSNGDYGGGDPGALDENVCRNCQQAGHFARECPEPKKMSGECFNCGEVGHNKADCPNPKVDRPFTGTCRLCEKEGHRAAECPDKGPDICKNCLKEGHKAAECTDLRALDFSKIPDLKESEAWAMMVESVGNTDIEQFRLGMKALSKVDRTLTYQDLETKLRERHLGMFLIAVEREVPRGLTAVNLQGKVDQKYILSIGTTRKPKRSFFADGYPDGPEENMERLKDAGEPLEQVLPVCRNCNELGHIALRCPQEKVISEKREITCSNCGSPEHRFRDCKEPKNEGGGDERGPMLCRRCNREGHKAVDCNEEEVFTCRNCNQQGHKAADCTEPRSAANVECRKCGEMGHFAKDCPSGGDSGGGCHNCGQEGHMARDCSEPKDPTKMVCRNCDEIGHESRECPKPRDYSRVKCNVCEQYGHTRVRCPKVKEMEEDGGLSIAPEETGPTEAVGGWDKADGEAESKKDEGADSWAAGGGSW